MPHSILDAIGNTPMVEINKLNPNPKVTLLAKLEHFNPGGSVKDRAALYMIAAAEKSGELTPQKIVIEPTSGNTGIGLALVCTVKGYRLLLVMSDAVSIERQKILKARGADILLMPGHLGTDGAIDEAYEMARRLAKEEGLFVGMSSGAAMAGACRVIEKMTEGTVVVLFPDNGERYLSTSLFAVPDETTLKFFNCMTRKKEPFEPRVAGKVSIYSCGPTAHARTHLGEMRRIVFADLLCRYLEYRGYGVNHLTDINDLDDKAISASEKANIGLSEFTEANILQLLKK